VAAPQRIAPGQLEVGLVPELPRLPIAPEWKDQQRLWGHAFHPMCSYLAMFPAALTHAFIARYSRPGDVVLDPFSGRGTTPLQACAEGRVGVGNDLNPMAHLLTAAKVDPPNRAELAARVSLLRVRWSAEAPRWSALAAEAIARPGPGGFDVPAAGGRSAPAPLPHEVALAFHPRTLAQVLFVREALLQDDRADRFIAAALTGILHGRSQTYLSDLMPNSFSMAPRYVRDYVARTGFRASERDLFACLDAKLKRLLRHDLPAVRGIALLGDARDAGSRARRALRERSLPDRARLVVTSPPYLRTVKYGYYNWLRLWFLGVDPDAVDALLDDAHQLDAYLVFMRQVLSDLRPALTDDAVVVLVIGDVELDRGRPIRGGVGLAETVWERSAAPEGYRLAGVALDDIAAHRKMTKIWGDEAGRTTKTDRLLVMAPTEQGRRRALAAATLPIGWEWPPGGRLRLL
jgi:site-specific DNA-methyltransferase (adenine-specific)